MTFIDEVSAMNVGGVFAVSRDHEDYLFYIDPRDTMTIEHLFKNGTWSEENKDFFFDKIIINSQIRSDYQSQYNGVLITAGFPFPKGAQIDVLRHALAEQTWFKTPSSRTFNLKTLHICYERGWLAKDGKESRITAEGRRVLRCAELDEKDAEQKRRDRATRKQRRTSSSVSDL